jgi:hypothetical protein
MGVSIGFDLHQLGGQGDLSTLPALVAVGAAIIAWVRWGRRPAPQPVRGDQPRNRRTNE